MEDKISFIPLRELADVINGFSFKSNEYVDEGLRIIRISDVQDRKIDDSNKIYYPIDAIKEIGKANLQESDIVMSLTGNVGRVALIKEENLPCGLNQRVACIRTKSNQVLNKYLYYYLDSSYFKTKSINASRGNGQKNLSTKWLENNLIALPTLKKQQEIVDKVITW